MACNSSYMEANKLEIKTSQVACLLDEIAGKKYRPQDWDGYHPRVYCRCTRELADALVAELCAALRERDVTQYCLEMQIWWRDHQAADYAREQSQPEEPSAPIDDARAALAAEPAEGLSPKEIEAQEAFTQMRDEVLGGVEGLNSDQANSILCIIDNYTPEWV